MEKFNFWKIAKASMLAFVVSSFALSSCSKNDDDDPKNQNNFTDIEVPGQVLSLNDIRAVYPDDHNFGVWKWNDVVISVGDRKNSHDDKFSIYVTMDTLSTNVRILYYFLIDPSTVESSDVDGLAKTFKEDVYSADNGYDFMSEETVSFAGSNAKKLSAMQVWYWSEDRTKKIDCRIYKERYIFYDNDSKKVYSVQMEIPDDLRSSRYDELKGILSSIKVNK